MADQTKTTGNPTSDTQGKPGAQNTGSNQPKAGERDQKNPLTDKPGTNPSSDKLRETTPNVEAHAGEADTHRTGDHKPTPTTGAHEQRKENEAGDAKRTTAQDQHSGKPTSGKTEGNSKH